MTSKPPSCSRSATSAPTLPKPITAIRFIIAGRPSLLGASDVEPDALRQRQLTRVVDGAGLAAHVALPGIGAALAPAASVLLAAEGTADLGAGRSDVDVSDTAIGT